MWERTQILPEKWIAPTYGTAPKGFWVVAVIGQAAVWYDDIEDGFVVTECVRFGTIGGNPSGETSLEGAIQELINRLGSVSTSV